MKIPLFVLCSIAIGIAFAQADQCNYEGHIFKVGETYNPIGDCQTIKCNGQDSMSALTCPLAPAQPGCKLTDQDNTKPYPDCCPQIKCKT